MEYITFTKNLRLDEYSDQLEMKRSFYLNYNSEMQIEDNYAEYSDYGFCENDDFKAIEHAFHVLEKLNSFKGNESDKELLKVQLCQDFQNLIISLEYLGKSKSTYAKKIAEAIGSWNLEEELISIVTQFYRENFEDREEDVICPYEPSYIPEYSELYIKMGDRALFLKEDLVLAMKCYTVADFDWYHLRDAKEERNISDIDQCKLNSWHEKFSYYQHIISGDVRNEEILKDYTLPEKCRRAYCQLLNYKKFTEYERRWEISNQYFEALETIENSKNKSLDFLRSRLIIAHIIRQNTILDGLLCLYNENVCTCNQETLVKNVYKFVCDNQNPEITELRDYAKTHPDLEDTYSKLCLFAKVIFLARSICDELLVEKPLKDIAYYTSLENFFNMLPAKTVLGEKCGRLSVMNIAYMNDSNEGKILQRFMLSNDISRLIEERKSASYPYVFMKCFTSRIDDLPMWEMYGNHAEGCCLVVDWKSTFSMQKFGKLVPLYRVCYIKKSPNGYRIVKNENPEIKDTKKIWSCLLELRKIARKLGKDVDALKVFQNLLEGIMYLFKESSYHYEQEVRIYYNYHSISKDFKHTEGEYPMLFIQPEFDMHFKEIIIGPKFRNVAERMPYMQEEIEKMCMVIHAKLPKITRSNIEYK